MSEVSKWFMYNTYMTQMMTHTSGMSTASSSWRGSIVFSLHDGTEENIFVLQFVNQCLQLPFCIWAKHILATSSSFFGDSSLNGEAGGCCQQQRYISVVVMYGRSSVSLLSSSPSGCGSICPEDFTTFVFSGVSLFRRSRWHGDVPSVSNFCGVIFEVLPLDLWFFASNKLNFLGRVFTSHDSQAEATRSQKRKITGKSD